MITLPTVEPRLFTLVELYWGVAYITIDSTHFVEESMAQLKWSCIATFGLHGDAAGKSCVISRPLPAVQRMESPIGR